MNLRHAIAPAIALLSACSDAPPGLFGNDSGTNHPGSDAGPVCTGPCDCPDRGPPDFSREGAGTFPDSATADQQEALVRANHWRTAAGLAAFNANARLLQSAQAHANFMAQNDQQQCWPDPHGEIPGCRGFTGADLGAREMAAGYSYQSAFEVIDWESSVDAAVDRWLWSVYHRLPFLDHTLLEMGYGGSAGGMGVNNVVDFGTASGSPRAPKILPVFPVPGDTGVPTGFRGDLEGPTPPGPGDLGAWPPGKTSGQVISMHFTGGNWQVDAHHLYSHSGAACTEVAHTYIDKNDDPTLGDFSSNDVFLYANDELHAGTEYVVVISGMFQGQPFTRSWAFKT
jgi:hypothetical protein